MDYIDRYVDRYVDRHNDSCAHQSKKKLKEVVKRAFEISSVDEKEEFDYEQAQRLDEKLCNRSGDWVAGYFGFPEIGDTIEKGCGCSGTVTETYIMTMNVDWEECSVD